MVESMNNNWRTMTIPITKATHDALCEIRAKDKRFENYLDEDAIIYRLASEWIAGWAWEGKRID